MAITITPATTTPPTEAVQRAQGAVNAARIIAQQAGMARQMGNNALWNSRSDTLVTPEQVLAEIAEPDQVRLMLGDIALRIMLALKTDDPIAAFIASSPVPEGSSVNFADADAAAVDLTPEIVALLTKMVTIKTVTIA